MSKLKTYEVKINRNGDEYFNAIWKIVDTWPAERWPLRQFIFDDNYEWRFIMECTEEQMIDLKKKLNIK